MTKTPKPPAPKTSYVVRYDGAVVGTLSKTKVRYTHAVVAQLHEADVRQWAYATPDEDPGYRERFDDYASTATAEDIQQRLAEHPTIADYLTGDHEFCKARVADGFDAFAEQWRSRRIKWFEEMRALGWMFSPRVIKWLKPGETYNTEKERQALLIFHRDRGWQPNRVYNPEYFERSYENQGFAFDWSKVVPVETETTIPVAQRFAKMAKKPQRELLGLVCDKMIERQSWDEIAGLLTTYLEGDAPLILKLLSGRH